MPNLPLGRWSSQLFDLRAPSSTDAQSAYCGFKNRQGQPSQGVKMTGECVLHVYLCPDNRKCFDTLVFSDKNKKLRPCNVPRKNCSRSSSAFKLPFFNLLDQIELIMMMLHTGFTLYIINSF